MILRICEYIISFNQIGLTEYTLCRLRTMLSVVNVDAEGNVVNGNFAVLELFRRYSTFVVGNL